ncbi:DEKNAAC105357 [Brettanomyces naardenensis]|uniref:DEKNAAC105357 n=1 Tax=Brettanomyces naardenensis TaxID=13370 RepID=A0A448YTB4_BRENA|nr:DEKNAAC105357 [Brettanomyces naardenensis]
MNVLFRLDLLQCKFQNLNPPRFNKTLEICQSKRNNFKLLSVSEEEAGKLIVQYEREEFDRKYNEFMEKLEKVIRKLLKNEIKTSDKFKKVASEVDKDEKLLKDNIRSKVVKTVSKIYKRKIREKSESIPGSFYEIMEDLRDHNPHDSNSKEVESLFSKLYGKAVARDCIDKMRIQFRLILGPVRESGKKEGKDVSEGGRDDVVEEIKGVANDVVDDGSVADDAGSDVDKADDSAEDATGSVEDSTDSADDATDSADDATDSADDVSISADDADDVSDNSTDAHSPANSSPPDDFFTEPKKIILPALASGYYSGEESEEELEKADRDIGVKSTTTQRKNRRGQRARRKIWEKKYGKGAKHLVKEREDWHAKQQDLKLEYEARIVKRAEKQKIWEEREKEKEEKKREREEKRHEPVHPSWAAKRKLEDSLAHAKFQGKKMRFN